MRAAARALRADPDQLEAFIAQVADSATLLELSRIENAVWMAVNRSPFGAEIMRRRRECEHEVGRSWPREAWPDQRITECSKCGLRWTA